MDKIFIRQNDEDILELLFAQRISYNRAEKLNTIGWCLTLILLLLEGCKKWIPIVENNLLVINAVLAVIIFLVDFKTSDMIKKGSQIKNLIDCTLFGFPVEKDTEKLVDYSISLKLKYPKRYKEQINHSGDSTIKGVKDWYTRYNSENHNYVILNCQKENIWWNKKLVAFYKRILIAIVLGVIAILFISVGSGNITINLICVTVILVSTVLFRCISALAQINNYSQAMSKAHGKVEIIDNNTRDLNVGDLQSLQKEIESVRSSGFLIPNWIHSIYSVELHRQKRSLNNRIAR